MFAIYAKIAGRVVREPVNLEGSLDAAKSVVNSWLKKRTGLKSEACAPIPDEDWKEFASEGGELSHTSAEVARGTLKATIVIQHVSPAV